MTWKQPIRSYAADLKQRFAKLTPEQKRATFNTVTANRDSIPQDFADAQPVNYILNTLLDEELKLFEKARK